jgi:hypothetical protein
MPICYHFPKGECRKHNSGQTCPFAHIKQGSGKAAPAKGSSSRNQSKDEKAAKAAEKAAEAKKKEAKAKKAAKKAAKAAASPLDQ